MVLQNSLLDPCKPLVFDASVLINLNASGYSREILGAFPNKVFVTQEVMQELKEDRKNGSRDFNGISQSASAGNITIKKLNDYEIDLFEQMVIGPAGTTLDVGEASTIAYAARNQAIAIIDERKAHRICKERYASLFVGCTIDIFAHPAVQTALGAENLHSAIVNALSKARMSVFPEYINWIIKIIGQENAGNYQSLPRQVRLKTG